MGCLRISLIAEGPNPLITWRVNREGGKVRVYQSMILIKIFQNRNKRQRSKLVGRPALDYAAASPNIVDLLPRNLLFDHM